MDERRPNPPGWVPPKAPYNPYDPTDVRPPQGYPSEFKTPGKPSSWSVIPNEPTNYRQVKETLKKLQYVPRPLSQLYPGQYKVLRRTETSKFRSGVKFASTTLSAGLIIGIVFFYRWNDGYDHVFSTPYRWQLRARDYLFGNLSPQQKADLKSKKRSTVKVAPDTAVVPPEGLEDTVVMQRARRYHLIEAERIRQEREEAILRAVDIAEAELASGTQQPKRKKWLGIF